MAHVLIRRQRPLLHNDEKAATKNENQIDKPGQLLAQGFKLACSVDRVGVQARATAVQCYCADKATTCASVGDVPHEKRALA